MLDAKDIQQIGEIFENKLNKAIDENIMPKVALEVGEIIEQNVMPAMEELGTEIAGIKEEISGMKEEISGIKAVMVTKEYLDDKLADLRGDMIVNFRKLDGKTDHLIGMLNKKKIISEPEVREFEEYRIFPKLGKV